MSDTKRSIVPSGAGILAARRAELSRHPQCIGLDYIEVQNQTLRLHFVPGAEGKQRIYPHALTTANIRIYGPGGAVWPQFRVAGTPNEAVPIYTLELLGVPSLDQASAHDGAAPIYTLELLGVPYLDPLFARASFVLQPGVPSVRDPQPTPAMPTDDTTVLIDYLSRDYQAFRQLMIHRLSVLVPNWQELHPADLSHTLVELLAYTADQLSYYQDAVATEAYLGTARRRVSVARHARLLGYRMHQGCNARTWVHVQVADAMTLPVGTRLLTCTNRSSQTVLSADDYGQALADGAIVFETMHPADLNHLHNELRLYDWHIPNYELPRGACSAALVGAFPALQPGYVLIFEAPEGAHAIRLTAVQHNQQDELFSAPITLIAWHANDALPFSIAAAPCLVRGNIVLADHGLSMDEAQELRPARSRTGPHIALAAPNLTYSVAYQHDHVASLSATQVLTQDPREALAAIPRLESHSPALSRIEHWYVRRDLLDSDRFSPACVVEIEDDGRAQLRFGDGQYGRRPQPDSLFHMWYRVGKGRAGNVGRAMIGRLYWHNGNAPGTVIAVHNPLPALGGTDPELTEHVRLYAPATPPTQQRCVLPADYVAVAKLHPEVQYAAATSQWAGSWNTMVVVVVRHGGQPVDAAFQQDLLAHFEPYRIAGTDITVRGPTFVAPEIELMVVLADGQEPLSVLHALRSALSDADLPTGRGFFHPDAWSFGQSVFLSQIVALAARIPGVAVIEPICFRRWEGAVQGQVIQDQIVIGPLEVIRLRTSPYESWDDRIRLRSVTRP